MTGRQKRIVIAAGTILGLGVAVSVSVLAREAVFDSYVVTFLAMSDTVLSCF
jgi:hypothetical protein